ncbi:efflux RND transporter periplasmic adaptor subunit [Sphingomonas sp.]|uniref:efflux RND transporter periplasmic adaptor subunit n=1 Tax=Sphingomonas sp. TaxID=28214 RepID=UPI0025CE5371|nr:efflux RND transporter periplasmic adaptor subunit [Sphingomonas sp.]
MRKLPSRIHRAILVSALLGAIGACSKPEKKAPPTPEAGFVTAKTESVPLTVELAGRTAAYETSEVRPQVSGIVRERLFTEGKIVRAGQTLYQIDASLYRAASAQAQANLQNASAAREAAQAKADRYRPLAKIEAVSQQDLTDASAAARQAGAGVAQTRAALDTANINLRFTRIAAPITGRIGRSLVTPGALVTSAQVSPMTTIQRLDPMFVDIQQSSADFLALRRALASGGLGMSSAAVKLTLEDGSDYAPTGTVQFAEAMVDANTGSVTLRARFPNSDGLLLPGMYVRARLAQGIALSAILVPQQAISRDAKGGATLLLVGPNNKAVQRAVSADRAIGNKWLVTKGLKPGDRVITEGLIRIKPGQAIKPVPAGSKPAPIKKRAGS